MRHRRLTPTILSILTLSAISAAPKAASAQQPYPPPPPPPPSYAVAPPPEPPPEPAPPPRVENGPRPAKTGFQAAFRTGLLLPAGKASGVKDDTLARRYSIQWPLFADLGWKITENIFIGTYMGFGVGAEGSDAEIEEFCDDDDADLENDISCSSASLRIGLEAHYQFEPAADWNPWIGYGFGYVGAFQTLSDRPRARTENTLSSGITYAQLSGGIDYRAGVGIGPFAELSLGEFRTVRTKINNEVTFRGPIDDRGLHLWMMFGVRMVVRP